MTEGQVVLKLVAAGGLGMHTMNSTFQVSTVTRRLMSVSRIRNSDSTCHIDTRTAVVTDSKDTVVCSSFGLAAFTFAARC